MNFNFASHRFILFFRIYKNVDKIIPSILYSKLVNYFVFNSTTFINKNINYNLVYIKMNVLSVK